jgi:hypothetical protein
MVTAIGKWNRCRVVPPLDRTRNRPRSKPGAEQGDRWIPHIDVEEQTREQPEQCYRDRRVRRAGCRLRRLRFERSDAVDGAEQLRDICSR